MSSYSEGFKLGYSANAPLAGISEGIKMFTQEYRKQQEIGRQRQEAYDKARSEFKSKQEETYGKYAKEDLYDNTGFTDFDTLGDKFTKSALETYEINEFAFRNGFIDESELTARNNNLKAQSQKLTKMFGEANTMLEQKDKLEAQGLGNRLNDVRLDLLEDFSKNVKVSSGLDGLYMSTIGKDGKQKNISVSEFSKILQADPGVDMQKDLDALLELGGYKEYKTKDGKRIIRSFDRSDELGIGLIKTKVESYTDQQVIDAMFELGIATDDPKEAKEGVSLIGTKNIFDFEVNDETRSKLATAMQDELRDQQKYKMISSDADPDSKGKTDVKTPKYDRSYYNEETAKQYGKTGGFYEYTFKDPKPMKGLSLSGFKIPVYRDQDQVLQEPTVVAYRVLDDGTHEAKISSRIGRYPIYINPQGKKVPNTSAKMIEEEKFSYVPLKTRTEVNQVRSRYGISILTDKEQVDQTGILD